MTKHLNMAALALAALALAGCASNASLPAAAHTAATSPAAAPSSPAALPSPLPASTARLTIRQAARAYTEAVDPSNQAGDVINNDYTDRVPLAQFRRDEHAYITSLRTVTAKLAAVRWPARVGPYVTAMLSTDVPADIRCTQDELRAHSYSQVDTISFNQDCTAGANTSNADTIRSLLHLPSLSG
jgi:hypothetical protein